MQFYSSFFSLKTFQTGRLISFHNNFAASKICFLGIKWFVLCVLIDTKNIVVDWLCGCTCRQLSVKKCRDDIEQVCKEATKKKCFTKDILECDDTTKKECKTIQEKLCKTQKKNVCTTTYKEVCTPKNKKPFIWRPCSRLPKGSKRKMRSKVWKNMQNSSNRNLGK